MYSGFTADRSELFDLSDFQEMPNTSDHPPQLSDTILPQRAFDLVRVAVDDSRMPGDDYLACIYDATLFNSKVYFDAVGVLSLGGLKKCNLDERAWDRYQMRARLGWKGTDSLHDTLLLLDGNPRPSFDVDGFLKANPGWESHMEKR